MNKIMNILEEKMVPIASKMNRNKYLTSVRDGFIVTIPLTIFGSIFLLIPNFPFLDRVVGADTITMLNTYLGHASTITMNLTSLVIAFAIAYNLARKNKVDSIFGGFIGLFSFLMVIPFTTDANGASAIGLDTLGAQGMFLAIIAALVSGISYNFFVKKGWTIKMPEDVPENVANSFTSLVPLLMTLTLFLIIRIAFTFTPYGNALTFIYEILQIPLSNLGGTLGSLLVAAFCIQMLWMFGLHGALIVGSIYEPILMMLSQQNFDLIAAGSAPVNVINLQFYQLFFTSLGGSGSFLALALALIFVSKKKEHHELGKLGLPAAVFNIAEPLLFGLPTVLNPLCFIPLIVGPLVTIPIAYYAVSFGLVPIVRYVVPWTTPPILNGIISTGSISGGILQLIMITIMFFIWVPFVKMMSKQKNEE